MTSSIVMTLVSGSAGSIALIAARTAGRLAIGFVWVPITIRTDRNMPTTLLATMASGACSQDVYTCGTTSDSSGPCFTSPATPTMRIQSP